MPYITEELWQHVAPKIGLGGETISKAPYPVADLSKDDAQAEADVADEIRDRRCAHHSGRNECFAWTRDSDAPDRW